MLAVLPESFPAIFTALLAVTMATLFFCCWRKKEPQEETATEKQGVLPTPQNGTVKEAQSSYGSQEDVGDFSAVQRETEILRSYRKPPPPRNRGRQSRAGRAVTRSTEHLDIFTEINEDDELNHFTDSSDAQPAASPVQVTVTKDDDGKDKDDAEAKVTETKVAETEMDSMDVAIREKSGDEAVTRDTRSSMLADIEQTLAAMHREETGEVKADEVKDDGVSEEEKTAESGKEEIKTAADAKADGAVETVKEVEAISALTVISESKIKVDEEKEADSTVEDKDKDVDSKEVDNKEDVESKDVFSKTVNSITEVSKSVVADVVSKSVASMKQLSNESEEKDSKDLEVKPKEGEGRVLEESIDKTAEEDSKVKAEAVEEPATVTEIVKTAVQMVQEKVVAPSKTEDETKPAGSEQTLAGVASDPVKAIGEVVQQVKSAVTESAVTSKDSAVPEESKKEPVKEDLVQKVSGAISHTAAEVGEKLEQQPIKTSKATFEISKIPKRGTTTDPISVEVSSPTAAEQLSSPSHKKKAPKVSPKPSRIALAKAGITLPTQEPSTQNAADEEARSSQSSEGPSSPSAASANKTTTTSLPGAKKDSAEPLVVAVKSKSPDASSSSESAFPKHEAKAVKEDSKKDSLESKQSKAEESAQPLSSEIEKESPALSQPAVPPMGLTLDSTPKSEDDTSHQHSETPKESQGSTDQPPSSPGSPTSESIPGDEDMRERRESEDGSTKGKSRIPVRAD